MPNEPTSWFDAHLDLAYLAEIGRDMHAEPKDARGRLQPASVTLPSLHAGGVRACLATVFTEPVPENASDPETGAFEYPAGDVDAAERAGLRQLKLYEAWQRAGAISWLRESDAEASLRVGVLLENADPVRSPEELKTWADAGVVAVGLCWALPSRYAAGNATEPGSAGDGLTGAGREMVGAIDALGLVHDLSHLSQRATEEVLSLATGRVIASHSNARALLPGLSAAAAQRHLTDDTIRAIGERDGVIGINLYSAFLSEQATGKTRATINDVIAHIERVCDLTGSRTAVALGSDMDGGFGADRMPDGVDGPSDLERLAEALSAQGWSDAEVDGFRFGNWARFWGIE